MSCRHSGNAMRNYVSSTQVLRRNFASRPDPHAFSFFPEFFSRKEQGLLLSASLKILDSLDTRLARRRRADFFRSEPPRSSDTDPLELFAPDDLYHFQEVSLKAILTVYACFTDIGALWRSYPSFSRDSFILLAYGRFRRSESRSQTFTLSVSDQGYSNSSTTSGILRRYSSTCG